VRIHCVVATALVAFVPSAANAQAPSAESPSADQPATVVPAPATQPDGVEPPVEVPPAAPTHTTAGAEPSRSQAPGGAVPGSAAAGTPAAIPRVCALTDDCPTGLRCHRGTCLTPETQEQELLAVVESARATRGLTGTRPFLGGSLGAFHPGVWGGEANGGVQATFRAGSFFDRIQLQLEFTPGTALLGLFPGYGPIGLVEGTGSVGVFLPISDSVSWVLRGGAGLGLVIDHGYRKPFFDRGDWALGFAELRMDLAGLAIQTSEHFFLEVSAPSYRVYFVPGSARTDQVSMAWITSVGFHYLY
jgi:hypothetical protein